MKKEALDYAQKLIAEAEDYVDNLLGALQSTIITNLKAVKDGRGEIAAISRKLETLKDTNYTYK